MPRRTAKSVKSSCNGVGLPGIWNDSGRYPTRQYFLRIFAGGDEAWARCAAGNQAGGNRDGARSRNGNTARPEFIGSIAGTILSGNASEAIRS
jgi:hypothetical protein